MRSYHLVLWNLHLKRINQFFLKILVLFPYCILWKLQFFPDLYEGISWIALTEIISITSQQAHKTSFIHLYVLPISCGHIGCGRRAHLPALGGGHSKHHYYTCSITNYEDGDDENVDNIETAKGKGGKGGKKKGTKILRILRSNSSNLKRKNSKSNRKKAEEDENEDLTSSGEKSSNDKIESGVGRDINDNNEDNEDEHIPENISCRGHEVCIDIVTKAVHCYACDDYVLSDAPWLAELRTELSGIELRRVDSPLSGFTETSSTHSSSTQNEEDEVDDNDYEIVENPNITDASAGLPSVLDNGDFPALATTTTNTKLLPTIHTKETEQSTSLQPSTDRKSLPGITGLNNLGNTCYMNSVIQMLSHCSGFRSFFRDFLRAAAPLRLAGEGSHRITRQSTVRLKDAFVEDHSPSKLALTEATHALLRVLWSGRWSSISPRYFVNAVWKHGGLFAARKQQDANEFLNFYLGRVDDELRHPKSTSSVLMDLFGVDQYQEVKCDECKTVTKKTEPLLGVVLSLPDEDAIKTKGEAKNDKVSDEEMAGNEDVIDLLDCFNSLRTTGRFVGENKFDCDTCHAKKDASWSVSLQRRPQSLLISFRRTLWSLEKGLHKDSRRVKFPLELDASELLELETDRVSPDIDFEGCHYTLISVVSHSGSSPFVGHYISWCRVGGVDSNKWFLFNDSNVTEASESDVLNAEAFILLYERRGIPSV